MKAEKSKWIRKTIIILFWLAVWQLASLWIDNAILLVGPFQVLRVFAEHIIQPEFWKIAGCSFLRIGLGFFGAFLCGMILGAAGYHYSLAEELLSPLMAALKSIPVASFVVLLLIWFGAERLSFFVSFLIVFPNVYVNTIAGLRSTNQKLLEMARVFGVSGRNRFFYIYRPALLPYLNGCLKISLGMSWKSGVAAEVIGLPDYSLGERLYMSKIYLDTAGLFAWTLTVILLSFLFEKAVLYLLRVYGEWKPYPSVRGAKSRVRKASGRKVEGKASEVSGRKVEGKASEVSDRKKGEIKIDRISKSYDGQRVLVNFSFTMEEGGRYLLMAPSGAGKTTLLRILNRLETEDSGAVSGIPGIVGMVFQEDCLCEEYDALTNIMLTMKVNSDSDRIMGEALQILPRECLTKPVKELSGGMRRRVAILRAMLSGASVIIMDEPFTGLDEENRIRTAAYILSRLQGRTLIATTHRKEDAALLRGVRVELAESGQQEENSGR